MKIYIITILIVLNITCLHGMENLPMGEESEKEMPTDDIVQAFNLDRKSVV